MRAAVAGGGIFGCTTALELASAGLRVDLYERRHDVMLGASRANQGRLHAGFHYPRSLSTATEVRDAAPEFTARFPTAVGSPGPHYYLIAEGSRVSAEKYLAFCDELGLPYTQADRHHLVRSDGVDLIVRAESEAFVDLNHLRLLLRTQLRRAGVRCRTGTHVEPDDLPGRYDWVVDATYGRSWWRPLRYEVTEVALVRLGENFAGQSFVVLDGPFVSLDPVPGSDLHMLYDVTHSVHHVSGTPEVPSGYRNLVDQGVRFTSLTAVAAMEQTLRRFVRAVGMPEYRGSLFTVRAVLPDVDGTDERPTLVERDGRLIRVLSGKIATAVPAAKRVVELAREVPA